jgi:hypothetical protein
VCVCVCVCVYVGGCLCTRARVCEGFVNVDKVILIGMQIQILVVVPWGTEIEETSV